METQLSFLNEVTVEKPKPTWQQLLEAGLKANELPPITREDVRRARENQGKN